MVMVVRVFVAGETGGSGSRRVPQSPAQGHRVTVTSTAGPGGPARLGADRVVVDGPDAAPVGVFDIADDNEPAPPAERLPRLAACAGAQWPKRVPVRPARLPAGDQAPVTVTEGRGVPSARAERELSRQLTGPSRRQGCKAESA
jgi:hypothetical protein